MSWHSWEQRERVLPMLDLHGFHQEDAIRRVTDFLEVHTEGEAIIITGSGSHSSCGPVLRTAVEQLLNKRQIIYQRDSPGSFRVDCASGVVFYKEASTDTDTKLVVDSADSEEVRLQVINQQKRHVINRRLMSNVSEPTVNDESSSSSLGHASIHEYPSVQEIAEEDWVLERSREDALILARQRTIELRREQKALQRAVSISLQEESEIEQRERELLERAIELSHREQTTGEQEEQVLLKQAIEASQVAKSETLSDRELEAAMREAIEKSKRETNVLAATEEDLRLAIERSLLLTAPSTEEEEERLMREVLALSLQYC